MLDKQAFVWSAVSIMPPTAGSAADFEGRSAARRRDYFLICVAPIGIRADLAALALPQITMAGARRQGVGDLVEDRIANLSLIVKERQRARERDQLQAAST